MKRALLVSLLLSLLPPAYGQSPATSAAPPRKGPVTYGSGPKLCSDWIAAETKADQTDYVANRFWVAGFMSAYNVFVSAPDFDIGKGTTPEVMKTFMHARCEANPTETIAAAGKAFIEMLKARQAG